MGDITGGISPRLAGDNMHGSHYISHTSTEEGEAVHG